MTENPMERKELVKFLEKNNFKEEPCKEGKLFTLLDPESPEHIARKFHFVFPETGTNYKLIISCDPALDNVPHNELKGKDSVKQYEGLKAIAALERTIEIVDSIKSAKKRGVYEMIEHQISGIDIS